MEKQLGSWRNIGSCEAIVEDTFCGPGNQAQTRTCFDGKTDKCISSDRERTILCSLPDCEKELGTWRNVGDCLAIAEGKTCGPGLQKQTRTCTDGTNDKCTPSDQERRISCNLRDCEKQLGSWENDGNCVATGGDKTCGPGNQKQTRTCDDGTVHTCTTSDTEQTIPCSEAGTNLKKCPGK